MLLQIDKAATFAKSILFACLILPVESALARQPGVGDHVRFPDGGFACLSKTDAATLTGYLFSKRIDAMKKMLSDDGSTPCVYLSSQVDYTVVQAEYNAGPDLGVIAIVGPGAKDRQHGAWTITAGAKLDFIHFRGRS